MRSDWFTRRQTAIVKNLPSVGVSALIVTHLPNIRYLFNFTGSAAIGLITYEGSYLIVDARYFTQAKEESSSCRVLLSTRGNEEALVRLLNKLRLSTAGFEAQHLPYSVYRHFNVNLRDPQLVPLDSLVENIRITKDDFEIEKIRQALELTWTAFDAIIPNVKVGVCERDLAVELEYRLLQAGASKLSFDTIIASGYRSAMPHGVASPKTIQKNEFVIFDFGIYLDGYASDMTRTVFVGKPTPQQRKIYKTVTEAMDRTIANVKPGLTGQQLDRFARGEINRQGFGRFFRHGTGHGIGLEVHELPYISKRGKTKIGPKMVFTIEPGIYIPRMGGVRVEDIVAVTESGCDILTQYTRELIIL